MCSHPEAAAACDLEDLAGKKQAFVKYEQAFDDCVVPKIEDECEIIQAWLWLSDWDTTYEIWIEKVDENLWQGEQQNTDSGTVRDVRGQWVLSGGTGTVSGGDQWGMLPRPLLS